MTEAKGAKGKAGAPAQKAASRQKAPAAKAKPPAPTKPATPAKASTSKSPSKAAAPEAKSAEPSPSGSRADAASKPASDPATRPAPPAPPEAPAVRPRAGRAKPSKEDAQRAKAEARRQRAVRLKEAKAMREEAKELLARSKALEKAKAKKERHDEYLAKVGQSVGLGRERDVTPMPPLAAGHRQLTLVEVRAGRAYIRLSYNETKNRHVYEVIEPPLEEEEPEIMRFIEETLVKTLDGRHSMDPAEWEQYLEDKIDDVIIDHSILVDGVSKARIKYHIVRDFLGYGPVDVLMRDPLIEDISCDGPNIPLYVFHRKHESIRTNVVFPDDLTLDAFVIRLAQRSGKHISVADPLLDATLPDGSRLQTTLSREVTTRGSSFTVRKFREDPLTPPSLIRFGTMSADMAAYFWMLMEEGSSLIYAGGTASGKTTSLNAVCQFIPPEKKVVSIEDTREINLLHENWIAGLTRAGFGSQDGAGHRAGAVDMYKLLEAALRQRPEYMIVGEVRGAEALTLFQAMATGHAVYSTMHADSVSSAVHRLENPPINVPRIMLPIMDAMAIQVQTRVNGQLVRRVREVTEMAGADPTTGDLLTNGVFRWNPETDEHEFLGTSTVLDRYGHIHGMDGAAVEKEWKQRARILQWMTDQKIDSIGEMTRIIHDYYRRPDEILKQVARGAQ